MSRYLRVVRSTIHGYGVVAGRSFKAGQKIAGVEGIVWTAEEKRDDTFSLLIKPGLFLDLVDEARWINHSCNPNASMKSGTWEKGVWARLVAKRAIREGEEVTYDYAYAREYAVPCECGAKTCRKLIIDEEEFRGRAAGGIR